MATSGIRQSGDRTVTATRYGAMTVLALFFLFPILYMFVSSLKPNLELLSDVGSLRAFLPVGDISLDNYAGVFKRVPAGQFIFNSLFVTSLTVVLGLIVNSMAGFALSRLKWRGRELVFTLIIATLIVPFETIAIPLLFVVSKLPWIGFGNEGITLDQGWLNSYQVQILPFVANGFSIFLFAQYFKSLPVDLDEAARVDGASWLQIYRRIIMPLSGPVVATVAILTFLPMWNAYLWPLMVTQSESIRPVMVGLQYFFQLNVAWGEIMAYLSMITLPVLVLFLALQRAF
ncbi:MAG: carbohydrate ABC transporter permease, partial [Actinobacteria bacterium]|nr:carbohydrate ABC transporter permease [Actinomycetota bacterium]